MGTTTTTKISHGQRLSVKLPSLRHGLLSHNFTAGSVRGHAQEHGYNVERWEERARRLGHSLYFLFNEGFSITAHRQEVVERTVLSLGQVVEFDGLQFRLEAAPNRNVKLVPVVEGERGSRG